MWLGVMALNWFWIGPTEDYPYGVSWGGGVTPAATESVTATADLSDGRDTSGRVFVATAEDGSDDEEEAQDRALVVGMLW